MLFLLIETDNQLLLWEYSRYNGVNTKSRTVGSPQPLGLVVQQKYSFLTIYL